MANPLIETSDRLNISSIQNQSPIATDDTIAGKHAGLLYITPAELLANDRDIDGDNH